METDGSPRRGVRPWLLCVGGVSAAVVAFLLMQLTYSLADYARSTAVEVLGWGFFVAMLAGLAIAAWGAIAWALKRPGGENTMAIVALVLGIALPPLAIPFGHVARSQIKRTGEPGMGLAVTGLWLGYTWLAAIVAVLVMVLLAHRM